MQCAVAPLFLVSHVTEDEQLDWGAVEEVNKQAVTPDKVLGTNVPTLGLTRAAE